MSLLNKEVYTVGFDSLIYDNSHTVDGAVVMVAVPAGGEGIIKKGQVIDFADGSYSVHKEGGMPSVIAAEDTEYAEGDAEVAVQVYTSGAFRAERIIYGPGLITDTDTALLRTQNIYLK